MTAQPPSRPATSALDARTASAEFSLSDDGSSYTCVRVFGAPPDRVYRAFTDPADLALWFPSGAPDGSELTRCESTPAVGGEYRYEMVVPGFGTMSWFGNYTGVEPPHRIEAEEWFVMGDGGPDGPPAVQTLTFEEVGNGLTRMHMQVRMPQPEDPEEFVEQSAAGLSTSLAALDELVSA